MIALSDARIKRIKTIKQNEFDEQFIREFYRDWNVVRKLVEIVLKRYEKMYRDNKNFRDYVDRYMRNKEGVKLKDVLKNKKIKLVADQYESEGK